MTTPTLLPGNRFRAYRGDGANPQNYAFICLATSITLTLTNAYEDATVPDCDDPLKIPVRQSVLGSTSWGGRIAGQVDAVRLAKLRADAGSQTPIPYKFLVDQTLANLIKEKHPEAQFSINMVRNIKERHASVSPRMASHSSRVASV